MKELLCAAFCDAVSVRSVPLGFAVETPYANSEGEPLIFYLAREAEAATWRIMDDGTQVPLLEAAGIDISPKRQRGRLFTRILSEHGATYDNEEKSILISSIDKDKIGSTAVGFMAMLLRVQDLFVLDRATVRATWREDALADIVENFGPIANVETPSTGSFDDYEESHKPDIIISRPDLASMVVYFGTSEERALKALVHKMNNEKYLGRPSKVALVMEKAKENPVTEATYALSQIRLDAVVPYKGTEKPAIRRLMEIFGAPADGREYSAA